MPELITSYEAPLVRLQQTLGHLRNPVRDYSKLAFVQGPTDSILWDMTLGELLQFQCLRYSTSECLVVPWTGCRWTYGQLEGEVNKLAKGLIAKGVRAGDTLGVMAGNCEQYVALFFAAARVGAILAVLNNTYTKPELLYALKHADVKILFVTPRIGKHSVESALAHIVKSPADTPGLEAVIILRGKYTDFQTYDDVIRAGYVVSVKEVQNRQDCLSPFDVCNLQFTSGSTGNPKASMLTHHNLVNNSRFVGDRMDLRHADILCCPPPLFHCFGLVLGLLACITHGAKIVYPGETFSPSLVLKAISDEKCTALHGVPTMFEAILNLPRPEGFDCSALRTGIIAGAPVPRALMKRLFDELNMTEYTSSYGLTEASPTCFNAVTGESINRRLTTVGKVMPHAMSKIIDPNTGRTLNVGERGELCISGYQIHKGYWKNPEKTAEALLIDEDGRVWLRTGDEAVFDSEGYCSITGRFKDIIIRGGENIYPLEIEERLTSHPSINRAAVIGVPNDHYGEVVGAFLILKEGQTGPSDESIRAWTMETLAKHKAPQHIWVFGKDPGLPESLPQTGSGKVQKQILRDLAKKLMQAQK
ncbi:SIN component scaffold protein Sid4 [Ascosphaera aggregata]|nr:SIN component scaffold protein Sid4 [Ascosphaera aggregata]